MCSNNDSKLTSNGGQAAGGHPTSTVITAFVLGAAIGGHFLGQHYAGAGDTTSIKTSADYINAMDQFMDIGVFTTFDKENGEDLWTQWEDKAGVHVVPMHYYSGIVSTEELEIYYGKKGVDSREPEFDMEGWDWNVESQQMMLNHLTSTYFSEVTGRPEITRIVHDDPRILHPIFGTMDESLYHTVIRHFKPNKIIEVGSGRSAEVSSKAVKMNKNNPNTTIIEPYPDQTHTDFLTKSGAITTLIVAKVQDVPLAEFKTLGENDILFIDSSHALGARTDSLFEILTVLPHLKPGVLVHVHDIFLPFDQPAEWCRDLHRFWTEQYLLHAFLLYNTEFELVVSSSYLRHYHSAELLEKFPEWFPKIGTSFWFRRKVNPEE